MDFTKTWQMESGAFRLKGISINVEAGTVSEHWSKTRTYEETFAGTEAGIGKSSISAKAGKSKTKRAMATKRAKDSSADKAKPVKKKKPAKAAKAKHLKSASSSAASGTKSK
jgi:hypothetical protein